MFTVVDRASDFLAGPDQSSLAGAVQSYGRFACRQWARTPAVGTDGRILGLSNVCTQYLEGINEEPFPGSGGFIPGGQCDGTLYGLTAFEVGSIIDCSTSQTTEFSGSFNAGNFYGPIQGTRYVSINEFNCGGVTRSGIIERQIYCRGTEAGGLGPLDWYPAGQLPSGEPFNARLIETYRLDITGIAVVGGGDPLECGQRLSPPQPRPNLPPLPPQNDTPGPFGDVPVGFEFGPDGELDVVGPDGTYRIDPFGPGGALQDPAGNSAIRDPNQQDPVTREDGEGVNPPEGEVIVAVRIRFIEPWNPGAFDPFVTVVNGRDSYFPRTGYVSFITPTGGLEGPYDINTADDVIPVRFKGGARRALFTLPVGQSVRVTAYTLPVDTSTPIEIV